MYLQENRRFGGADMDTILNVSIWQWPGLLCVTDVQ